MLVLAVIVGPYVLRVPPRRRRDWLAVQACIIWIILMTAISGVRS